MAKLDSQRDCCASYRGQIYLGADYQLCNFRAFFCNQNPIQAAKQIPLGNSGQLDILPTYTRDNALSGYKCCTVIDEVRFAINTTCISSENLRTAFSAAISTTEERTETVSYSGECKCGDFISFPIGTSSIDSITPTVPKHEFKDGGIVLLEDFTFTGHDFVVTISELQCIEPFSEAVEMPMFFRGKNCFDGTDVVISLYNAKFEPVQNFPVITDGPISLALTGELTKVDGKYFDMKRAIQ